MIIVGRRSQLTRIPKMTNSKATTMGTKAGAGRSEPTMEKIISGICLMQGIIGSVRCFRCVIFRYKADTTVTDRFAFKENPDSSVVPEYGQAMLKSANSYW